MAMKPEFRDTSLRRYCDHCGAHMNNEPDACLGFIPGVSHACCGHGHVKAAYVCLGGRPNEPVFNIDHVTLRGEAAITYFDLVMQGEWSFAADNKWVLGEDGIYTEMETTT
jgi:hypothetical protein